MTTLTEKTVRPLAPRLRRWGVVGAVLAVLALGGFFCWRRYQDRADCKKALQLAEQNKFTEAQPLLLRLHERYPNKVEVVRALALGYLYTQQGDEAETFLNRWCQLQPGEIEPYRQRHNLWISQQKVAPAMRDAQHILRLNPDDFRARFSLITLLMIEGRNDEAEKEAQRCYQAQPGNGDVWFLLANIYRRQGRIDLAADFTDRLLRVTPDHAESLKLRAQLYLDAGQPEPAIALLQKLAADGKGLYELSVALRRAGREDEANKAVAEMQWRRAMRLWSQHEHRDDNTALQEWVVQGLLDAGKTDDAVRFLSDILKRNPKAPPGTHQLLATCYEKLGQSQRAAEERRRATLRP